MSEVNDHKTLSDKYKEVGVLLSSKRNELSIELADMAKSLKVSAQYIAMIEDGDYENASKAIYYHGCVGAICRFLGMNDVKVLDYLLASPGSLDSFNDSSKVDSLSVNVNPSIHLKVKEIQKSNTKLVYKIFIVLSLLVFGIYSCSKANANHPIETTAAFIGL